MSALFLALFLKSVFKKKMLLLCYFICQIRVGGSGMDMRSKARVTFLSLAIFGNLLLLSISIFDITKSLIYSKSCLSVDSSWTSEWPFGATKVELWWLKHRPSSWWRQWSHLIVNNRFFLILFHTNFLHKHFSMILFRFLFTNLFLCFVLCLSSPQAIFKDPFRGGNNILVSFDLSYCLQPYFFNTS